MTKPTERGVSMGNNGNRWPTRAEDRLRTLWPTGQTKSEMAAILNAEFDLSLSPDAVTGKAHRLGLAARPSPIMPPSGWKQKDPRRLPKRPSGVSASGSVPEAPSRPAPASEPLRAAKECRWTDCDRAPWIWCGEPCQEGSSYCEGHHTRVWAVGVAKDLKRLRGASNVDRRSTVGSPDKIKFGQKFQRANAKWSL